VAITEKHYFIAWQMFSSSIIHVNEVPQGKMSGKRPRRLRAYEIKIFLTNQKPLNYSTLQPCSKNSTKTT